VLSSGVLQQCDRPQVVFDHPANLFVAGFMGSPPMNLFEAAVSEGARAVSVGSQQLQLNDSVLGENPALRAYAGRRIVLGIRPEDLGAPELPGSEQGPGCALTGQVELVEALGSEQLIHFTTDARVVDIHGAHEDDAKGLDRGTINQGGAGVARIDAQSLVRAGDAVRFRINPRRLRFFDPETTQAIGSPTNGASVAGQPRDRLDDRADDRPPGGQAGDAR
jgi:multiple sugar transport system ATP-binding protein